MGGILGGKHHDQTQTTTQAVDPFTDQIRHAVYGSALNAARQSVPGLSPYTQQAIGNYQQAATAGNLGLNALSGNQGAISQLMNPYQQNVINQVLGQYGDLANLTTNQVNDQATASGAFGGSRQGVAQGVALGQLNKDLGNQIAGLQYQGYNNAMGQAGQLANLGLGANGQLASLGDYARQVQLSQNPAMHQFQILQSALQGMPYGTTSTSTTPMTSGGLSGALGGAASGFAVGGPIGAGIGGLLGLFG